MQIDPSTFRAWLRILQEAPNAILWLLKFPELGEKALRETAAKWAPHVCNRIYFTDVAPKQQHIARARVCDLFLDTPECNAHTTAADVLWSSTPLLTLPRYKYKMCARMAASILKGALPKGPAGDQAALELIADDDDAYEAMAVKLANGISYHKTDEGYGQAKGRLWDLRKLLFDARWHCGLFDTQRWVRDLEDAYEKAWSNWVLGNDGDIYLDKSQIQHTLYTRRSCGRKLVDSRHRGTRVDKRNGMAATARNATSRVECGVTHSAGDRKVLLC